MSPKKPYRPPRNSNYPLPSASVDAAPFYRPPLAEEYGSRKAYEAAQGYWDRTQALYASCGLDVPDGPYVGRLAPPGPPAWMRDGGARNSYDTPGPKYDPLEKVVEAFRARRWYRKTRSFDGRRIDKGDDDGLAGLLEYKPKRP